MHRVMLSIVALLGVAAIPAWGQPAMPGSFTDEREFPAAPAGARVKALIDAINTPDEAKLRTFLTDNLTEDFLSDPPLDEHVSVFHQFRRRTGGVEFYSVRKYDPPRAPNDLVAIVRTKATDEWRGLIVSIEPGEPHKIAHLTFSAARPPAEVAKDLPKLSVEQIAVELKQYVEKLSEADVFSGAVLVARDGKPLLAGAWGQANKTYNVPNTLNTRFNLGSMNKMFTAVAIAQLVERGKLSLDDPIEKYLDADWIDRERIAGMTVRHLLTHTSGLGDYFTDEFWDSSRLKFREIADFKPLVRAIRPEFKPGERWQYSNAGFLLLGAMVEKASGMGYYAYIRENIYKPAGMNDTDSYDVDRTAPNLAVGYSSVAAPGGGEEWESNTLKHVVRGGPAGGGYSTVDDLLRFDQALRSGKLIRKETLEQMWTPTPASQSSPGGGYGMGFGVASGPLGRVVGHSGGFPGISAALDMHLDSGFTVAVLSNYDGGAMTIQSKVNELLGRRI
jgi:CubicO group peptidase (beta-lactamase class C family)